MCRLFKPASPGWANRWLCSVLLVCGVISALAWAAEEAIQPLESIRQAVQKFLLAQQRPGKEAPEIQLSELDPRLRLAKCALPLEAFLPSGAPTTGNLSIGVRCPGPRPWTVYQRVSVRIFGDVLVASRFLAAGTILGRADFRVERRDITTLAGGYETAPEHLLGKRLRSAFVAGAVLSPRAVKTVPLIRQGEIVTLVVRQGGMEVSSSGTALSDADLGQRVRVRNEGSRRVVEGTVTAQRRVEVGR